MCHSQVRAASAEERESLMDDVLGRARLDVARGLSALRDASADVVLSANGFKATHSSETDNMTGIRLKHTQSNARRTRLTRD